MLLRLPSPSITNKYQVDNKFCVQFMFSPAEDAIIIMIKTVGTDSKQVSINPTSWSKILFSFCPSDGFLIRR